MSLYSKITMNNLITTYNQDSFFQKVDIKITPIILLERLETFTGCELFLEHSGICHYFQKLRPSTGKLLTDWIVSTEKMSIEDIHNDFSIIINFVGENCKDLIVDVSILSVVPLALKHLMLKFSESIVYNSTNLMEVLKYY
jgi:hypothetical protein